MRIIVIETLVLVLVILLPVPGAFFGYVVGAFFRLDETSVFWLMNAGSILLAPTLTFTPEGIAPGPAGYVLTRGLLSGFLWNEVVLSLVSMIALTVVNIRISKYIKQ